MGLDWLQEALTGIPAAVWVYIGLGIPWSLVVLPRKDWHSRALVIAIAFALGPALLTGWMFVLGTIGGANEQALLQSGNVFAGTVVLFSVGVFLAWRKSRQPAPQKPIRQPLAIDEKLLIVLIFIAVILRWIVTAFWTFTAYDALWVYGYEGRLYTLQGFIPQSIDYYPQFLPLQFTYIQLAVGGIADHAARMVLPFLHIGSILAAYLLGERLFTRRTGIILAAVWALHPHVGQWAYVGDLEIPLAFLFTLSAALFLKAWTAEPDEPRRQPALLAGIIFSIAMWTKPTAAAFIWGVALLVIIEFIRVRGDWRAWLPRFEVAFLTGLATIPLGALWYVRNILLRHHAIDLPPAFWLTQARRSGDHFGWLLLALIVLLAFLYFRREDRPKWRGGLLGLGLTLLGVLPSFPLLNPARFDPPQSRMGLIEWAAVLIGVGILVYTLIPYARQRLTKSSEQKLTKVLWGLLLATPYFMTWFISYSYHYRLSFAIVPLLILPTAVVLAHSLNHEQIQRWQAGRRWLYLIAILLITLPGTVATLFNFQWETGWLWSDQFPNDRAKYQAFNPEIIAVMDGLNEYIVAHDTDPVIVAPGDERLPFFFPLLDIESETVPTTFNDLKGASHFVYSTQARRRYAEAGIPVDENQIVSGLARQDVMQQVAWHTDATFSYELYELDLEKRFVASTPEDGPVYHLLEDEVVIGDYVRYAGDNIASNRIIDYSRLYFDILWEVLKPIPEDYMIYVHLLNEEDDTVYAFWDAPVALGEHGYYSTKVWEPGEYIIDSRAPRFTFEEHEAIPPEGNFRLVIGLYSLATGERLPVTINGEPAGDGVMMVAPFTVVINKN